MSTTEKTKLLTQRTDGRWLKVPATLEYTGHRIEFIDSPFALKDEIKAMRGSKWHGYDTKNPRKIWTIEDCPRNRFQLQYMQGEPVYDWYDQEISEFSYERPLMPHQCDMTDHFLTYRTGIMAVEMGCGKTLSAQEVMERSGFREWFWVSPRNIIPNTLKEFKRWVLASHVNVTVMSYEDLVKWVKAWTPGTPLPHGIVFDEASKLKNPEADRTKHAQLIADMMREQFGKDVFIILASGTPAPKNPADIWSLAEIACPGFLREGSRKALEQRLSISIFQEFEDGSYPQHITWKDDENKCNICGMYPDAAVHHGEDLGAHTFEPSINEVSKLNRRLDGLMIVRFKKDVLAHLPDKTYRTIVCDPSKSVLRAASAITANAVNTISGLTLLRELSDGFQYEEEIDGTTKCDHCPDAKGLVEEWYNPSDPEMGFTELDFLDPDFVDQLEKREMECPQCSGTGEMPRIIRTTYEVPCPKEAALKDLLEENEDVGRIVIFSGFTGSVDRITGICHSQKWDVVRCDGRGLTLLTHDGRVIEDPPLDYWADLEHGHKVAFNAHPESGGMGFTLTEARMSVFWSNSFKPEYRTQSEDRIHRKGMDENAGCTIVDLLHLPSDHRVLEVIRSNRRLELMTLGSFS